VGASPDAWRTLLLAQVRGAIAGGVTAVQIRERGLDDREHVALLRACVDLTRGTSCRVIVNDRADLALVSGADGVHLRESSISIADARQLLRIEKFLVGRSVHDAGAAVLARTADYLVAGSVFETASKPGRQATLGLDGLRAVVDAAGKCPVWAIGGVTQERMSAIVACGVRGVAAIGAFLPTTGSADVEGDVQKIAEALRFSLDRCS
jgi:thiamine-phosphate pyrophosphorylase